MGLAGVVAKASAGCLACSTFHGLSPVKRESSVIPRHLTARRQRVAHRRRQGLKCLSFGVTQDGPSTSSPSSTASVRSPQASSSPFSAFPVSSERFPFLRRLAAGIAATGLVAGSAWAPWQLDPQLAARAAEPLVEDVVSISTEFFAQPDLLYEYGSQDWLMGALSLPLDFDTTALDIDFQLQQQEREEPAGASQDGSISVDVGEELPDGTMIASVDGLMLLAPAEATAVAAASAAATWEVQLLAAIRHFVTGTIAGCAGATAVYPLDLIKTRMQAQRPGDSKDGGPTYKNSIDCLMTVVRTEGIGGLYSGLKAQLVGTGPEKATKLTVYGIVSNSLATDPVIGSITWVVAALAGAISGGVQAFVTNPVEAVKTQFQLEGLKAYTQSSVSGDVKKPEQVEAVAVVDLELADGEITPSGTIVMQANKKKGVIEVAKELGMQKLYLGFNVCLAREIPYTAIFFSIYSCFDNPFVGAFIASIPASALVTPMDVVKTRLNMGAPEGEEPYKNGIDCFQRILQQEGWKSLFTGAGERVVRGSPQFGVMFFVFSLFNDN